MRTLLVVLLFASPAFALKKASEIVGYWEGICMSDDEGSWRSNADYRADLTVSYGADLWDSYDCTGPVIDHELENTTYSVGADLPSGATELDVIGKDGGKVFTVFKIVGDKLFHGNGVEDATKRPTDVNKLAFTRVQ